ncbi:unnamed protein product [Urochloa decumbens]|uniref:NB-ARC domain-containing protein n=1 Tax=Urochloa decumbens TaxID=240449 RepID=A0ABC9BI02_9POAL
MPTGLELATAAFGLANSALDGIVKVSAISDKIAVQLGVERDLAFIHDEFAMMQAFLKQAEKPRAKSSRPRGKVVDTWVRQVRVQDCLEDSALRLRLRRRSACLLRLPRAVKARRRIASDIRNLRAQVDHVSKRRLRYSLVTDDDVDHPSRPPATGDLSSGAITDDDDDGDASGTVGHHEQSSTPARRPPEASSLADLITGGGSELRVISVWGRDDHGRVSLPIVREAYDDASTRASGFTWRAWVHVAHPFKPHEFINNLLSQLDGGAASAQDERFTDDERWFEFERQVEKNKFLFVLDDLAGAEEWFWIKKRLPDKRNGSRIVVCAQHQGIAMLCPDQPIQVLGSKPKISDGDYELLYGHPPPPMYLIITKV